MEPKIYIDIVFPVTWGMDAFLLWMACEGSGGDLHSAVFLRRCVIACGFSFCKEAAVRYFRFCFWRAAFSLPIHRKAEKYFCG